MSSDEYLERERAVSDQLSALDSEVKNAQRRLDELSFNVAQFEHLREELKSRFSGHAGSEAARRETGAHGTQQPAEAR